MTSANVAVIRRGLDAFARRDLAEWRSCFDPAVVVHEDPGIPDAGRYDGHDGLMRWLHVMERNWENFQVVGERFVEAGDSVAVLVQASGRAPESGIAIRGQFGSVFVLRGGVVVGWTIFAHWADALATVS